MWIEIYHIVGRTIALNEVYRGLLPGTLYGTLYNPIALYASGMIPE